MKLQTSIPARRDGTLSVQGLDGKTHEFTVDAEGVLTADIEHEATVAHLLGTGNFYPESPEDFDAALRLSGQAGDEADADTEATGDDLADDDGIEQPPGGLPVEANSPLKPLPDPKAGGKRESKGKANK